MLGAHRRQHHRRQGHEEQGHADARHHEGQPQLRVAGTVRGGSGRARPGRWPAAPARRRARAGPRSAAASAAASGATSIGMPVQGRTRRPGGERRVVLDDLEELRQEEDRAEHPEAHEQRHDVHGRERPAPEQAQRQHGMGAAPLPRHEGRQTRRPRPRRTPARPALVQPWALARTRPSTTPSSPTVASTTPPRSSGWRGPEGLRQAPAGQHHEHDPDGHVDPEDRLPRPAARHRAADQRARRPPPRRRWRPTPRAPGSGARARTAADNSVSDSGMIERAARALHGAGRDQPADRRATGRRRPRRR